MRRPDGTNWTLLEPGDYCRKGESQWSFLTPNGIHFVIDTTDPLCHMLIEHEDNTVTLSPSVACSPGSCGVAEGWHGYLERGRWRSC